MSSHTFFSAKTDTGAGTAMQCKSSMVNIKVTGTWDGAVATIRVSLDGEDESPAKSGSFTEDDDLNVVVPWSASINVYVDSVGASTSLTALGARFESRSLSA